MQIANLHMWSWDLTANLIDSEKEHVNNRIDTERLILLSYNVN